MLMPANGHEVHYIGMSQRKVGSRLFKWLYEVNKVQKVLKKSDVVLIVSLDSQPYMSLALESYLISKLETRLNIKR